MNVAYTAAWVAALLVEAAAGQDAASRPTSRAAVDHARFDALLKAHVSPDGRVDYAALAKSATELDGYLASLKTIRLDQLSADEQTALWINAFNAATLRLVVEHYPMRSVTQIPSERRGGERRWVIAGRTVSLDEIENEQLRVAAADPRVYFALNRATRGDPPLRPAAYTADDLADQLDQQARRVHRDERIVRLDPQQRIVELARVYDWHAGAFKRHEATVLPSVAGFVPELRKALAAGHEYTIRWIEYDWGLNDATKREDEAK